MGNRKYRADEEGQTGSDYAYDNPMASTVATISGTTVGITGTNGVLVNGEANGKHLTKKGPKPQRLTSISKVDREDLDDGVDENSRFGWLWWRPRCLQVFNTPLGFCFMQCLVTLVQGMTAFGFVYISLSTLEKRFFLNSVQTGSISSAYDFSSLIVAVCVGYMGERGHRPLWVGFGSMLFCAGSIIFAIPHFVTPNYVYQETASEYCSLPNETYNVCDDVTNDDEHLSSYYWFFITAQVLHGIGASSLYTLGIAYVDENVSPRHFGIFMGVYNAIIVAGPSIGYIVGGAFLNIYTDLNVDRESLAIDVANPLWVGAWWIGFIMNGILLFVLTLIYMGFPKALPGSDKIMAERKSETQKGREFESEKGALNRLKALPRAVCTLFTNVPFMCLNGASVSAFFLVAGIAVFGPKYLESQLSMTPSEAAYAMGIISVTGGIAGALIAGVIINRFDLRFRGLLKMSIIGGVLSVFSCGVFLAECPTIDFAGVTVQYENKNLSHDGAFALNATCNSRCSCSSSYDPVCGSDGIMYYSPCHAGCNVQIQESGEVILNECLCVSDPTLPSGHGTVVPGTCPTDCWYRWLYFVGICLIVLFGAVSGVSGWTATIRCVSHSQRAFAMGIQTFIYSLIGTVPGPIVFGALLDGSCLLWETGCNGSANCWLYDNHLSARGFLILSVSSTAVTTIFAILCHVTYKPTNHRSGLHGDITGEFTSQAPLDTIA